MPLIKQLQNTVNYQFLYEFLRAGWSGVGNTVGANFPFPNTLASNPTKAEK
jgi:hypothetical protein